MGINFQGNDFGFEPIEASGSDFGFEPARLDSRQSVLRAAPSEGIIGSAGRAVREFFSPVLGPTDRQVSSEGILDESGNRTYRPAGSRVDREGMVSALFAQNPESPFFIERAPINPESSTASQVLTGARNVGANLVNTLSSPGSLLTMGSAGLMSSAASKALGGAFAADVARHVPEAAAHAGEMSVAGSPGEQVEAFGNLGLQAGGVLMGGIHAAQSTRGGNAIRAINEMVGDPRAPMAEPRDIDLAVAERMDPRSGDWTPLPPDRLAQVPEKIRSSGARQTEDAFGFTPIDRAVAENRFGPDRPVPSRIIPVTRAVREGVEGGKLPEREYPGERQIKGDYEPPPNRPAPEPVESSPLRTQAEILREKLATRDMTEAVRAIGEQPVEIQGKIIDQVLGIDRKPVPLDAAQKIIFNESWEAALQKSLERDSAAGSPGYWERVNSWADKTIQEGRKSVSSGVDPTMIAAHAVKAADLVGRGVAKTYEVFRDEFVKRFPDAADMARDVWDRLTSKPERIMEAIDSSSGIDGLNEATRSFGGSVTSLAYRVGEMTDTPAKLAKLDEGMARFQKEAREAIANREFDKASALAMKGQFYREAREYATGTGSAGTAMKSKDAGFVPPMSRGDVVLGLLDRGIESLKGDRTAVMEGVTGLPVWLTREAARGVLQAVKAAYVGSKSLSAAIEKGVRWMKENGIKAEDAAMRDWLDSQLRWERVGSEADAGPMKTRKSIERIVESKETPKEVREKLAQDPESQYPQQLVSPKAGKTTVTDLVDKMTEAELGEINPRSNIYIASKLELAKRHMRSGDYAQAYRMFKELAAEGTLFGQLINQFLMLKGVDPTSITRILNRQLLDNGYDPLTETQAAAITEASRKAIEAHDKLEQAKKKWRAEPTEENAAAAEKLLEEAKAPALELQREILSRQPKSLPAVLKAVIQGNLLTPISEVSNIVGNLSMMPFRGMSEAGAAAIDMMDSFIRKRPRELVFNPVESLKSGASGFLKGTKEIPGILAKGQSQVKQGEQFRGLHPLKAWSNLIASNPDVPTVSGKVKLSDRMAMAVEATFGVPAEVMLRGLGAGDAPFRAKAHGQALEQQLTLSKTTPDQRAFARKFPELFLTKEQMQRVHEETLKAVFQQHSDTISTLNRFIKQKGGEWGDLGATVILPYRHTPWNLIGEYLSYNPIAGMLNATAKAAKGDKLGAERAAAKAVVGGAATYAAWWLYQKGLLSPSLDDSDEQQKARLLSGTVLPPNHINISGLKREMNGEDPSFRPGDTTVDTWKMGLFGAISYTTANLGRDFEKQPEDAKGNVGDWIKNSVVENMRFGLNQSFLKGTATILDAVQTGRADDALRGIENVVLSVPVPNTVSAISRATSGDKVVVKDDDKLKEFGNLIGQRLRVFGAGKDLPVKRGVWGEPIPETPEGANPWAYHFLDITRSQQVTQDPVNVEIYRLWRRHNDPSVIPTPPASVQIFQGKRYVLDQAQQSELAESVGSIRRRIAEDLVQNPNFQKLEDDAKKRMLERAYATGLRVGKGEFFRGNREDLIEKGTPAGFVPR